MKILIVLTSLLVLSCTTTKIKYITTPDISCIEPQQFTWIRLDVDSTPEERELILVQNLQIQALNNKLWQNYYECVQNIQLSNREFIKQLNEETK